MYKKNSLKIFITCALAMALTIAALPADTFAAANKTVNTVDPDAADKADDLTKLTGINPTATNNPDTAEDESYVDTDIDVWGYTKNTTVYSVDVEWGAMTFEYEASSWNPGTHMKEEGAGWKVYDNTNDKVITEAQDAINRVTVTNHSNAPVYAGLSYAGEADYTATTGEFAASTNASTEDVNATFDSTKKLITLQTADNGTGGAAGTPSKGNVYFMPTGIADSVKTTGIAKWTTIGKITVSILTEEPGGAAP